ncbi:ankyrin repeat-containing domain protein [Lipomyces oligophaga]|uniref:ankyrin repeat-containing domain protein n=1 Tax=Lipomyces oligophaga TaxID=45792 RepID=UPI0034CF78DA
MNKLLTEEQIDELLSASRYGELDELKSMVQNIMKEDGIDAKGVIAQVIDPFSRSTPLHMASANGDVDIATYLLGLPAAAVGDVSLVSLKNESGNTPLHWACLNGHIDLVALLCDAGADPFEQNFVGQDSVFQAENNDKMDIVEYLLKRFESEFDEQIDEKENEPEISDGNQNENSTEFGHEAENDVEATLESLNLKS